MTNKTEDKFYFGKPGQPERFAEIKASDLYAIHDAIGKRAIAAYKSGPDSLAAKYDSWIEMVQDMISLARDGKQDLLKKYARGLPSELRKMLPSSISFARRRSPARYTVELDFSNAAEQSETSKNDDMAEMLKQAEISLETMTAAQGQGLTAKRFLQYAEGFLHSKTPSALRDRLNRLKQRVMALPQMKHPFSRPGQPERFGLEDACWEGYEPVGTKQKDGRTVPNCVPKDENAEPEEFAASDVASAINRFIADIPKGATRDALQRSLLDYADNTAAERRMKQQGNKTDALRFNHEVGRANEVAVSSWLRLGRDMKDLRGMLQQLDRASFSRPGSPDKFDASSLDRGNFAEASQSPMLGKLLAAKVMPEGGWRAVQVGSDTLVISFEDADLASDFGRRVATKGYNATSPVQAIGRYWNVEVKNDGK